MEKFCTARVNGVFEATIDKIKNRWFHVVYPTSYTGENRFQVVPKVDDNGEPNFASIEATMGGGTQVLQKLEQLAAICIRFGKELSMAEIQAMCALSEAWRVSMTYAKTFSECIAIKHVDLMKMKFEKDIFKSLRRFGTNVGKVEELLGTINLLVMRSGTSASEFFTHISYSLPNFKLHLQEMRKEVHTRVSGIQGRLQDKWCVQA